MTEPQCLAGLPANVWPASRRMSGRHPGECLAGSSGGVACGKVCYQPRTKSARRLSELIIESSCNELADFSGQPGNSGELCRRFSSQRCQQTGTAVGAIYSQHCQGTNTTLRS